MVILTIGLIIFFGIHIIPSFVGYRSELIKSLGEAKYKGLYSITAVTGLVLIIYGKSQAEFIPLWEPVAWSKNVVIITMIFAFYLFAVADMKSNFKRFIRHPMLLGIILWSAAHLFANGDLAAVLLFGSFFTFSLFAVYSANVRGAAKQEKRVPLKNDMITIIAGIVAYVVFIKYLHPFLIGVSII